MIRSLAIQIEAQQSAGAVAPSPSIFPVKCTDIVRASIVCPTTEHILRLVKLLKTQTEEGQQAEDCTARQSFVGTSKGMQNNMGLKGKRTRQGRRGPGQGQGDSSIPSTARSGFDSSIHSDTGGYGSDMDSQDRGYNGGSVGGDTTRRSFEGTRRSFGDDGGGGYGNAAAAAAAAAAGGGGGGGRGAESEGGFTIDPKASTDEKGPAGGEDISLARARGITIESIKNRFKQPLPHGYRDVSNFSSFLPHSNLILTPF